MHAIHDQVAELIGVATGLYLRHHIDKELIANPERFEIVALHALLDGGCLDHAHPHHEHLPLADLGDRVEELQLQKIELLGRQ